jgi:hypothetical protein
LCFLCETMQKDNLLASIVILAFLGAILNVLGGVGLLTLIASATAAGATSADIPGWVTPLAYLTIALGVIDGIGGVMLLMYKRLGLLLVAATTVITLIINIISVVTGNSTIGSVAIGRLIQLAILYYLYIYLTREPEKSFFT